MTDDLDPGSRFARSISGVDARARWLLFTHPGRITLAVAYSIAAVVSIATYTVVRSPLYGLGQLALTSFGVLWARWCLRRVAIGSD